MAVYNIFAAADTTLYSRYPVKNSGRDPILEVSVKNSQDGTRFLYRNPVTENPYYTYDLAANGNASTSDAYFPEDDVRRSILQFSPEDLNKLYAFASQSISSSYQANLVMYLAFAQNLSIPYTLEIYPVSQSWTMGTGQYAQVPESVNGASWLFTGASGSSPFWQMSDLFWENPALLTWDTTPYFWNTPGTGSGGSWYNFESNQAFGYMSNKDLNANITNIFNSWYTGSITNNGLIVKHPFSTETDQNAFIDLKFFSVDTHTIYPPAIQFKWADAYYYPVSTNYVLNDQITITLANNPGEFSQNEVYKMRLATRYTYPPRQFTTSSIYLTNLILSEKTYWALQDVKTNEMIVDFDENFTKISCDSVGNYFTLYTSGLEINRYYRLLIKTYIYSTTYGPLSTYDNEQSIYNALSLYGPNDLALLPAEEVIYSGQNLVFKIVA